jgi:hypothetical protein
MLLHPHSPPIILSAIYCSCKSITFPDIDIVLFRCHRLYTRAYLHHLLLSHELLADSMIFVHNRHVMLELFEASRIHMRRGDFAVWTEELLGKNVD